MVQARIGVVNSTPADYGELSASIRVNLRLDFFCVFLRLFAAYYSFLFAIWLPPR
jgi:hypothetical protein